MTSREAVRATEWNHQEPFLWTREDAVTEGPRSKRRRIRRARRRAAAVAGGVAALLVSGAPAVSSLMHTGRSGPGQGGGIVEGRSGSGSPKPRESSPRESSPLESRSVKGDALQAQATVPFGSHLRASYRGAVIRPAGSQQALDGAVADYYHRWQSTFIKHPCGRNWSAVVSPDADLPYIGEAQGWGMVITALMAGADPNAQKQFDGILQYVLGHPSSIDHDLHAAEQNERCESVNGGDSATDADLDIAYGLLLANAQWGSQGAYDYHELALRRIKAIKRSVVQPQTHLLLAGDWARDGDDQVSRISRSSDWMLDHFRAFRAATGDPFWDSVLDAHLRLIGRLQAEYSPHTGLLPDFVVGVNGTPRPADGEILESENDGRFWWNACRVPWRIGTDAVLSGDPRSVAAAVALNQFARGVSGDTPGRIRAGYSLRGRALTDDHEPAFVVPFAVPAMLDRFAQRWIDAQWHYLTSTPINAGNYYPATISLQVMLVLSGNWFSPA